MSPPPVETPVTAADVVAAAVIGRMERLRLNGWGGDARNVGTALAITDSNILRGLRNDPDLIAAFAQRGWTLKAAGRGITIMRTPYKVDPQVDWYMAHVHRTPGSVVSLADVRASFLDYCESRRIKVTSAEKAGITKMLDRHDHKRTRWKSDGGSVTGYRDTSVTFEPGVEPAMNIVGDGVGEPATDTQILTAMAALSGMTDPWELEMAYARLTGAPTRLCGSCGRLTVRDKHKWCVKGNK